MVHHHPRDYLHVQCKPAKGENHQHPISNLKELSDIGENYHVVGLLVRIQPWEVVGVIANLQSMSSFIAQSEYPLEKNIIIYIAAVG